MPSSARTLGLMNRRSSKKYMGTLFILMELIKAKNRNFDYFSIPNLFCCSISVTISIISFNIMAVAPQTTWPSTSK